MIQTLPIAHLPYPLDGIKHGLSAREGMKARDQSLALLRGQTNLLRLASDYFESYQSAKDKTVMHYRDYLIAEAILASLRSTMFTSADPKELNTRAERVLSTKPFDKVWPFVAQESLSDNNVLYGGAPGSPAFYYLMSSLNEDPITGMENLCDLIWNLHGSTIEEPPKDRLKAIKGYLGDLDGAESNLKAAVQSVYEINPQEDTDLARRAVRQYFIKPEDYTSTSKNLLYGTWDDYHMSLGSALLDDRRQEEIRKTMSYSDSIGKGAGVNLLLQALAVEGYTKAAKTVNEFTERGNEPLEQFLATTGDAPEFKSQMSSLLDLTHSAYRLQGLSSLYEDVDALASRSRNLAVSWLKSSGLDEPLDDRQDIRSFAASVFQNVEELIPSLSSYDSPATEGTQYVGLQGRLAKNSSAYLAPDLNPNQNPSLTLARIALDDTVPNLDFSALEAYVLHEGTETELTPEQYNLLDSASNVSVVQSGLPVNNLSSLISQSIDFQNRNYEAVNTLQIAPRPRGLLGYEEMIRGMVSHLFRDAPSDESINSVKVDGSREEHTSRVAGLLYQLKAVHINSEIPTLSEWTTFVEEVI